MHLQFRVVQPAGEISTYFELTKVEEKKKS